MFGQIFSPSFGLPTLSDVVSLYKIYRFVDGLNIFDWIEDWATKKVAEDNKKGFESLMNDLFDDQVNKI